MYEYIFTPYKSIKQYTNERIKQVPFVSRVELEVYLNRILSDYIYEIVEDDSSDNIEYVDIVSSGTDRVGQIFNITNSN